MEAGHRFVKIVSTSENLDIPGDIALQMQGGDVILRDTYEKLWYVGVTRSRDDQWYFKKGWAQFYKENSLEPVDFIVFEYKGGKLFDFKVLGHHACDKKGKTFDGGCYEVWEEERTESSHACRRNLRGEAPSKRNYRKQKVTGKKGVGAETHDVKEADKERENITKKMKPISQSKSSSQAHKITYCSGGGTDWYGADIFKSGSVPRPTNPFFVTRPRPSNRKNDLYIPKGVRADYQLEIPERLFLVDEHDRKWETKIKVWKKGRVWCNRGWGSLCNANNIGKDDSCICEFVQGENSNHLCIKVRCVNRVG